MNDINPFDDLQPITFPGIDPEKPMVMAGPCSAETEKQVMDTATQLARNGIKMFRAGIWKPRTKPGGWEGIGLPGLPWMREVKERTGMVTATEVATPEHVKAAIDAGIDILWIGARTSANPFAMQELADALRGQEKLTVLVKNPVNPDIELWIGALLRIHNAGIKRLGAIHRGFSTFGKSLYRNEPLWRIPIELRRRIPNLPIISDPSHMGGKRELIAPLSQQAMDMGFNGLIIESHCSPDCALSDAQQQVTPDALNLILNSLVIRDTKQSTEGLTLLRQKIDRCDDQLLSILSKRMEIAREIGQYKKEHNMQVVQTQRYGDMMTDQARQAANLGLDQHFIATVMQAIHEESVRQQIEVINQKSNWA